MNHTDLHAAFSIMLNNGQSISDGFYNLFRTDDGLLWIITGEDENKDYTEYACEAKAIAAYIKRATVIQIEC